MSALPRLPEGDTHRMKRAIEALQGGGSERTTPFLFRREEVHIVNHHHQTDADLLAAVVHQDEQALRELYQRHSAVVYTLALRLLHQQNLAEDIVQETFVKIWQNAGQFDAARGRAEAWIITIARNLAISLLRHQMTQPRIEQEADAHDVIDAVPGPEETAWLHLRRDLVRSALGQLPPAQRQMVILAYFDGLTHAEIAAQTGDPLGTVKSRLRLALRRLYEILQPCLADSPYPAHSATPTPDSGGDHL